LKCIRHKPPVWHQFVTPGEPLVHFPSFGRKFPFCFGGPSFSCPICIGYRILIGIVNNGMIPPALLITVRSLRLLPVCPVYPCPPLRNVMGGNRVGWGNEYQGPWLQYQPFGLRSIWWQLFLKVFPKRGFLC